MTPPCPRFGFDVTFTPTVAADEAALAALRADFLELALEQLDLVAQPSLVNDWRYTVTRDGGQATDADREAISKWCGPREGVAACAVGPLVDLSQSA